jgi:hypothetical protein
MIVVTGNNGDLPLATQRRVESIASGDRPSPSLDRIYQLGRQGIEARAGERVEEQEELRSVESGGATDQLCRF